MTDTVRVKTVRSVLNIDFPTLRKQKSELLAIASNPVHQHLMGIVNILDAIQDDAIEQGFSELEVFGDLGKLD